MFPSEPKEKLENALNSTDDIEQAIDWIITITSQGKGI